MSLSSSTDPRCEADVPPHCCPFLPKFSRTHTDTELDMKRFFNSRYYDIFSCVATLYSLDISWWHAWSASFKGGNPFAQILFSFVFSWNFVFRWKSSEIFSFGCRRVSDAGKIRSAAVDKHGEIVYRNRLLPPSDDHTMNAQLKLILLQMFFFSNHFTFFL